MTDLVINTINSQTSREPAGVEFSDINCNTTLDDYEIRDDDSDSDFEDDDRSDETSDDSTFDDDHELDDESNHQKVGQPLQEDQHNHFNIQEVNDTDSEGGDGGVGEVEVADDDEDDSINPILIAEDGEDTEYSDDSGTEGGGDNDSESSESTRNSNEQDDVSEDEATVVPEDNEEWQHEESNPDEEVESDGEDVQAAQRPRVLRELDTDFDGIHRGNGAVGSVIREYVVGSVIQHYGSLEVSLSTPQYGFKKGLEVFKDAGYDTTLKELDKKLIGKNVLNILPNTTPVYY